MTFQKLKNYYHTYLTFLISILNGCVDKMVFHIDSFTSIVSYVTSKIRHLTFSQDAFEN